MRHSSSSGFSLVELSIVLVILGLLTGGILAGQSLIRAAELRSVSTEYSRYVAATNTFRDKYFQLPGDMTNAHSFWGSAGGSGVIGDGCETGSTTSTETCSGNGNGLIAAAGAVSQFGEMFTFWQHLANAGLIEGSYTGIASTGNAYHTVLGENTPSSKSGNTGWSIYSWGAISGNGSLFDNTYNNTLILGVQSASSFTENPAFTPEEAWNIDTKMDDGKPATGFIVTRLRADCTDQTNAAGDSDNFDAAYALSTTSEECVFLFLNSF